MAHAVLKLIPGVDQNRTPALNEAAISSCNLIRFVPDRQGLGLPQALGGWTKFYNSVINSVTRGLWAWEDTDAKQFLAIAADAGLSVLNTGTQVLKDISPQQYIVNPVLATSGSDDYTYYSTTIDSNVVTVFDLGSNINTGDGVFFATPVTVGGLVLSGLYTATAGTADTYTVTTTNVIGSPVYATSTVASGGALPTFGTTIGSPTVTVVFADHGEVAGDTFTIITPTTVGGLTLSGNYIVTSVPDANTFTITAQNTAASTAGPIALNGGAVQYWYYITETIPQISAGYGAGGYGAGGYGTGVFNTIGHTFATVSASGTGSVATLHFNGNILIPVGSLITVAGVTPSGYNTAAGTPVMVTASTQGTNSTVKYASTATGAQTVAGTLTIVQLAWAASSRGPSLANWGEILIFGPHEFPIYQWNPASGQISATLVPNCPVVNEGMFVAMPQRQIIAYGSTFTGVQDPLLIRWCDVNDFTNWTATVTNQAGSYRIPRGSLIVGGMQGPQQGLIWTDLSVWAMQYIGFPYVYSFNEIATGCGLIGHHATGAMNGVVYWMSQSQFFSMSGDGVQPLVCPIWDVVFQNIDTSNLENIRCAPNSRFNEISWFYTSLGSNTGENDSYVKYNTLLNQWDFGKLQRTAWIDQSVLGPPIGSAIAPVPARLTGSVSYIYQHETATSADGAPLDSWLQTGYFQIGEAEDMMFLDQIWPDMKWGYYNGGQDSNINLTVYGTDYPTKAPIAYGPFPVTVDTTYVTPRVRNRLVSFKIESGTGLAFWRLGALRYRVQPDGKF